MALLKPNPGLLPPENYRRFGLGFDAIDAVTTKALDLQGQISGIAPPLQAAINAEVSTRTQQINTINDKLTPALNRLTGATEGVASLQAQVTGEQTIRAQQTSDIYGKLNPAVARIEVINTSLVSLQSQITSSVGRITGHDNRLSAVEAVAAGNTQGAQVLQGQIIAGFEGVQDQITDAVGRIAGHDNRFLAVEATTSGNTQGINILQGQIVAAGNATVALANRVDAIDQKATGSAAGIPILQGQIVAAGNATVALSRKVDTIDQRSAGSATGISVLQAQIVAAGNATVAINNRLTEVDNKSNGTIAGISVLQNQIIAAGKATIDIDARLIRLTGAALPIADSDAMASPDRPGEALAYFATSLAGGDRSGLPRPDDSLVAIGDNGRVLRMRGSGLLARRRFIAIEDGRMYRPRVALRRRVDASDPANDGVEVGVAWYDQSRIRLSGSAGKTVLRQITDLTVAKGRQQVASLISTSGGKAIKPPAGARYFVFYVQMFGADHATDVEVLAYRDVSDAAIYTPEVSAFDARLGAVESLGLGSRVGILETNAASPLSVGYISTSAARSATVPQGINTLDVLGYNDPGDGGGGRYQRSGYTPAHPWSVQTSGGSWFEIKGRRTLGQIGGKSDGTTDNAPIFAKAPAGSAILVDEVGTYRHGAGLIGKANSIVSSGPGVRWSSSGTGALNFAPGSRFEGYHEGADGQVRYFGHRPTGSRAIGTGAVDAGFSAASWMFDVRTDDSDAGGSFRNGVMVRHIINGGKGGVQAGYFSTFFTTPTAANNGQRNYVALQASHYQQSGDGGYPNIDPAVNGGRNVYQGAGFGGGFACYTDVGATFLLNQTAVEINPFGMPFDPNIGGPSVSVWTGAQIVSAKGTRGIDVDMALAFGSQGRNGAYGPEAGWKFGIGFTDAFGVPPLSTDSILFGSKWLNRTTPLAVNSFFDGTGFSFSDAVIKTNNMALTEGALLFGGKQVVAQRQPAVANATDAASVITQLNALLNAVRTHGLIAV